MNRTSDEDEIWMSRALELAEEAAAAGEVPVGAVVVMGRVEIGAGRNRTVERSSALAHAEIEALEQAFRTAGEGRLPTAVLYSTLEPCFMCTGALLHARVARVVFAAHDPKFGACGSLAHLPADPRLNHRCPVDAGLWAERSATMLQAFFRERRNRPKA